MPDNPGVKLNIAESAVRRIKAEALRDAADAIQALHPGEQKNSVDWLRARADALVVRAVDVSPAEPAEQEKL